MKKKCMLTSCRWQGVGASGSVSGMIIEKGGVCSRTRGSRGRRQPGEKYVCVWSAGPGELHIYAFCVALRSPGACIVGNSTAVRTTRCLKVDLPVRAPVPASVLRTT